MVNSGSWVSHIEAFVDVTRPAEQQKAGVAAVAGLVKDDLITLEALVKEMELYLTTTDDTIRARGILFLAEVLIHLLGKALDSLTISSLAGFFSSRLADWRSLRGALTGCLALLKRKSDVSMLVDGDARTLAQSMMDNVQVQLLAMHDRKLCFEVFQFLLDTYSDSVVSLGDDFVYGLIQAVDQEKDPRCLVHTFRLAHSLGKLFLSQVGSAHVAPDLFEVLSCYFPIYFTHKIADDFEVRREDLSDALLDAFCSTPYFEPFAIPLLLDKLSSSLPLAKIESLKYLNKCLPIFGAERMTQHALKIWFALKEVILSPPQAEILSSTNFNLGGDTNSHEHKIASEALIFLKTTILQFTCSNNDDFLTLIMDDNDVERSFCSVTMEGSYTDNSATNYFQLNALGSILFVMANSSIFCCNKVFQEFFPRLMVILGINSRKSKHSADSIVEKVSQKLNYGALYLCAELLASSRDLIATVWESSMQMDSLQGCWCHLIQEFSGPLTSVFKSVLMIPKENTADGGNSNSMHELVLCSVKGLQALATYAGKYTPVTKKSFEDILEVFILIIIGRSENSFLWKLSLKSLVQIGSSIARFKDSHMQIVYDEIVVRRLVLLLHGDPMLPLALTLEAISEIGTCAPDLISPVIQGLEEAMLSNFLRACVDGSSKSAKDLSLLLDCYCIKVLPWCHDSGGIEQPGVHFVINILEEMENIAAFKMEPEMQDLLDKMMMTVKLVVSGCAVSNQYRVLEKAYNIMLESTNFPSESLLSSCSILEGLHFNQHLYELTSRNKWLLYFLASTVTALHQQTPLTNAAKLLNLLLVFTLKGHLPAAQALASLVNKLSLDVDRLRSSNTYIPAETIEMILDTFCSVLSNNFQNRLLILNSNDGDSLHFYLNLQINALFGMAWFGKALLMRGDGRVKDIAMAIMKCLLSSQNTIPSSYQDVHLVARSAADAFHLILSDSDVCLNKNFHAIIRPLYKQRFFSSMLPVLHSVIKECNSSRTKALLYRAFGHTISGMPLTVLIADANKVLPLLLDSLSVLDPDILNKDLIYSLLLVLSGFLVDEKGKEDIIGYVHVVVNHLIKLLSYPHMMLVRETAIECLTAMTSFPYTRIYPLRTQLYQELLMIRKELFVRRLLNAVTLGPRWLQDRFVSEVKRVVYCPGKFAQCASFSRILN
ncbi:MMS19 nucleotide excision repair protein homolog isoform X3 [Phalaenopsis equestris]|uniref:MMS19 nucleotide excision repair protein homolog isoform X3 n=1 Tax=Phalaenopsis equestris TaxID=78828 RepID=UPI0009E2DBED|nr:MMS19 nucleotide excision repair protein homolog isoform X3 [Phalaenopsis equestris]